MRDCFNQPLVKWLALLTIAQGLLTVVVATVFGRLLVYGSPTAKDKVVMAIIFAIPLCLFLITLRRDVRVGRRGQRVIPSHVIDACNALDLRYLPERLTLTKVRRLPKGRGGFARGVPRFRSFSFGLMTIGEDTRLSYSPSEFFVFRDQTGDLHVLFFGDRLPTVHAAATPGIETTLHMVAQPVHPPQ